MTQAPINPQDLATFSDEQLWTIVGKQETLFPNEQSELESLVDAYDQYVLLRSQALLHLKQRGHDVEQRLKISPN